MPPTTVQTIIANMRTMTRFVAPCTPAQLGWAAFEAGLAETDVPVEARRGWRAAMRAQAYADGNAYLVGQGVTA